jgi:MOSC domain-containing protein YiiM
MNWQGELLSIFIGPEASRPMVEVDEVRAIPGKGLEGDRYFSMTGTYSRKSDPGREVTLIEIESIEALGRDFGIQFGLGDSRRNLVTRGVPLNHLVGIDFQVGEVFLRGIKLCEPCSHLASLTSKSVLPALVHRGGLRAQVLQAGIIRSGDEIRPVGT